MLATSYKRNICQLLAKGGREEEIGYEDIVRGNSSPFH